MPMFETTARERAERRRKRFFKKLKKYGINFAIFVAFVVLSWLAIQFAGSSGGRGMTD